MHVIDIMISGANHELNDNVQQVNNSKTTERNEVRYDEIVKLRKCLKDEAKSVFSDWKTDVNLIMNECTPNAIWQVRSNN